MAKVSIGSAKLSGTVEKYLKQYDNLAINKLTETITDVARDSVKKLKDTSPIGKTGKYHKGWRYTTERGRLKFGATIYGDKPTYQLAHLLEHGHAKRGGGRTRPIVHIAPVEEWANDELVKRYVSKMERAAL